MYATQHRTVATMFWVAGLMQSGARYVRVGARRLDVWLEERRLVRPDARTPMSEHELFDIGLARLDVRAATPGAADHDRDSARRSGATKVRTDSGRALVKCSLWLHLGFVGAAMLAGGLLRFLDHQAGWISALALAICGGLVAATSWRRARTVIRRADATARSGNG